MTSASPPPAPIARSGVVGAEREPILQLDDALDAPETLLRAADDLAFAPAFGPTGGYPGLRAPAPRAYVETMVTGLTPAIAATFGLGAIRPVKADCAFSIVTLPPDRLSRPQRAPHVDTTDRWQFAILHYLCDARFGGTAFYRHRATGYETVTAEREAAFRTVRAREGESSGYVEDGAPWFERIGEVAAAFNRVVVYRSQLLHSGRILAPELLSPDPRRGRLTANIFVTYAPD